MKKLLIISGKGGTGKTTTAAAFIHFSQCLAVADCDVDAPNLHIVTKLKGKPEKSYFEGSDKAKIDADKCIGCGKCLEHCRFGAVSCKDNVYSVNQISCEGCGVCEYVCPSGAVSIYKDIAGQQELYREDGVFSTAHLKMGRGNSGRLVTNVKLAMFKNAPETDFAVVDGSPGIGCPVIASVSGMDLVLVVAEPSLSGISDLDRLVKTAATFRTKLAVCVNKWDSSKENTDAVIDFCEKHGIPFVGKIPYDKAASAAVNEGRSIAETDCPARDALLEVYRSVRKIIDG